MTATSKIYGWEKWDIFINTTIGLSRHSPHIRMDKTGKTINFHHHGICKATGWEVDHVIPRTIKPSWWNKFSNLCALQWQENRTKSNKLDFLNKKIHDFYLNENLFIPNHRGTRLYVNTHYWCWTNSKIREPQMCKIKEINRKFILVEWYINGKTSKVYPSSRLFKSLDRVKRRQ